MSKFIQMILHTFTGKDNTTLDIGRILWFQGVVFYFGMSAYALYKTGTFDPTAWGTGFGLVLAGGGAALALKSKTEPDQIINTDEKE